MDIVFFLRNILTKNFCIITADFTYCSFTDATVRSILCYFMIGLFSTLLIISLWNSNSHPDIIRTHVSHFDKQQSLLYVTSDKFLSFGLDTSLLRRMNEFPVRHEEFINLGRHLSPAYVRVGGTSADCLTFDREVDRQMWNFLPII